MLRSVWSIRTSLLRDLKFLLMVLNCLVVSAERAQSVANVAVRPALAPLVASLLRDLKILLVVLDRLVVSAERFQRTPTVAVRLALAALVA
jgi:hypothetical protein